MRPLLQAVCYGGLNWIYCLIDRLPDRLPMSHRSKTVAAIADLQRPQCVLPWRCIYSVTTRINLQPVDAVLIRTFPQEYYLSSFGYNTKHLPGMPGGPDPGSDAVGPVTLSFLLPGRRCTIISGQGLWEEQVQVCRGRNASRLPPLG